MGSLVFSDLARSKNKGSSKPFVYVDLTFDLQNKQQMGDLTTPPSDPRDIDVSYDELAIKNSLINIFNTMKGQRFLIPEFGTDLIGYLFKPVTEMIADQIGNSILDSIELWEPRVTVDRVSVLGYPEEHEYKIDVQITIPKLKIRTNLNGVLSAGGFKEVILNN